MASIERWKRDREEGPEPEEPADPAAEPTQEPQDEPPEEPRKRGISGWIEQRAQRVVEQVYAARAAELEERAQRVMSSVYEKSADDMEERAVRALRRALEAEAGRIEAAIEHAIRIKKREVRLSLLVLVVSALAYLALYWLTRGPATP